MINPQVNNYIQDLLDDNKKLTAFNHCIVIRRKELEGKLIKLTRSAGTDREIKMCANYVGRLIGLSHIIRQNINDIRSNLEKIRELRNGARQEI